MRTKSGVKVEATAVAKVLTESAVRLAGRDLKLAKQQAALARRILLKYNIRLDASLKRFTCKGCKTLLVPGVNSRFRLGHGKPPALRVTCLECGHVSRKILRHP